MTNAETERMIKIYPLDEFPQAIEQYNELLVLTPKKQANTFAERFVYLFKDEKDLEKSKIY